MKFITDHWDLKLVALVLAVALWIYTSGQVRSDRTLDVQLKPELIGGLGDTNQITSISPSQFRVTLSVPSNRWAALPANDLITPRLEVRPMKNREQEFAVTSALLGIPSDIRIVRTEPENLRTITVRWDYIVEDELPAELPPLANVPQGLEAEVHLDVNLVKVRAAADVIEHERSQNNRLHFQPIDLTGSDVKATGSQHVVVELRPVPNLPYKVVRAPLATIDLHPVPASLLVPALPVRVLVPSRLSGHLVITTLPSRVTLTVRGPENLLKALKPDSEVIPYVDLELGIEPGTSQDMPIALVAPSWLTYDPVSVHVSATALPAPAPAVLTPPTPDGPLKTPSSDEPSPPSEAPPGTVALPTHVGDAPDKSP